MSCGLYSGFIPKILAVLSVFWLVLACIEKVLVGSEKMLTTEVQEARLRIGIGTYLLGIFA